MQDDAIAALAADTGLPGLDSWLSRATDRDLIRMGPKRLARDLGQPFQSIASAMFRGVSRGLLTMNWEYHCPHCQGIPDFRHNFNQVAPAGYCGLCQVEFRNQLDQNVEVSFTPHPQVHTLPEGFMDRYREEMMQAIMAGNYPKDPDAYSGLECLNNPVYQELFGTDVLSSEESLEIGEVTLLFTDIKGSTDLYSRRGDSASYRIVREHFKILFQAVEEAGGVVVKTIGDAVMASFVRPVDGVRAALAAWEAFLGRAWDDEGPLEIKMGLHAGSAIAVTMNGRVDYFGNTVNKAARVQGVAGDHTVCFTREILDRPGVRALLRQWQERHRGRVLRRDVSLKGIEGTVEFYRIQAGQDGGR